MSDFEVALPDGRTVSVQANSAEEAARGARNFLARESGAKEGTSQTQAAGNAFAQGGTFGFADELAAAFRSVMPDFMKHGPVLQRAESLGGNEPQHQFSNAPTIGQRYDEELANIRGRQDAEQKNFPATTTAANIAGNVGGAALALPAAATAIGPSLLANVVKGAAVGGGLGGLQGLGEGEGGFGERAGHALPAAAFGAVGGAAVPVAGKAVSALADTRLGRAAQENVIGPALTWAGEQLGGKVQARSLSAAAPDSGPVPEGFGQSLVSTGQRLSQPSRSAALEDFATTLQKSDISPEQIAAELDRLGPEGLFVDVNKQLQGKGRGLANLSGQTGDLAESTMKARVEGRPGRMTSAFEGGEEPPKTAQLLEGLTENTRAVGNEAYGAMRGEKLNISGDMQRLAQTPAVQEALSQIQADAASTGTKLAPIEIAHRVKQKLNQIADAAFVSGRPINKADLGALADQWERAFWQANPSARTADTAYAQAKSLPEFFDRGRNFMAGGTGEKGIDATSAGLADALTGANVQQATAARAGSTTAARDLMSGMGAQSQTNRIVRGINQGSDVKARLGQLYEPEQAGNIVKQAGTEQKFIDTERQFLNQSTTARQAAEMGDVGSHITLRAGSGGLTGYAKETVGRFLQEHFGQSEALRNEYGRLLFARDPETRKEALRIAEELLRQRAQGTAGSTAAGAALGAQLGR